MSTPPDQSARNEGSAPASATARGRFLAHMRAADSYGLVLIFIIVSYALAVSLHGKWAQSVVLFAQIVTVWFALRTSDARRRVLMLAGGLLLVAGVVAIIGLFTGTAHHPLTLVFVVSCLLYTIAPISIVRHIAFRPQVDQETMLGALCAYLFIGMAFAFT